MGVIRLSVTELADFFTFYLSGAIRTADADEKKELEKLFRFGPMRKFNTDNRSRFLQKYKIFINSLQNRQATRIEIISADSKDAEKISPDEERPSITKKIKRLLRKLTGTKNESLQEIILQEIIDEDQQLLSESENTVLKYI